MLCQLYRYFGKNKMLFGITHTHTHTQKGTIVQEHAYLERENIQTNKKISFVRKKSEHLSPSILNRSLANHVWVTWRVRCLWL